MDGCDPAHGSVRGRVPTMMSQSANARNDPGGLRTPPAAAPLHAIPLPPAGPRPDRPAVPLARDPAMRAVLEQAERLAQTDMPVLIQGESGAGKEVLAQYLHAASARAPGPLVAENCSAIPDSLAESILFGHVRGAFTGADRDRPGLFELADGGTLFLDEIGDMPAPLQARLLRVLEEGRVRPVGGTRSVAFDVRIVCATNHDLPELVRTGRFRSDLYYRLAGATLSVPALRERPADVELLATRFLAELNAQHGTRRRFAAGLVERMSAHPWPGNVRELKNCVAALYHLSDGDDVEGALPRRASPNAPCGLVTRVAPMAEIERDAIVLALATLGGDRREVARRLGISRSTLYVRIRELGLGDNLSR